MSGKRITRKEFLQNASLGLLGAGMGMQRRKAEISPQVITGMKTLGTSGICLTALGFGASRTMEESLLRAVLDSGINYFDTGRRYANGQNEVLLGKTLEGRRDKVVIQSKMDIRFTNSPDKKSIRSQMNTSMRESLSALRTDYIDIMLIHGVSRIDEVSNDSIMEEFTRMKERGEIRLCGFSCHSNQAEILPWLAKEGFYEVVMIPFNPFGRFVHANSGRKDSWDQEAVVKGMKAVHDRGIHVMAMKTTSGGPYSPGDGQEATFPGAIEWVLSHDFVTAAAVAMANFSQVEENAKLLRI